MLGGRTERADRFDFFIAQQLGVIAVLSALGTVLARPAAANVGLHV